MGTTCAEVLSTNCIRALWNPLGFLPYGLIYVFFIDYLFRKQVRDWRTVYLLGCLVGFITEAYFAKVLFWGWQDGCLRWHGFAVGEFFILVFFFHPAFSFMLPVFIAKNFFGYPFYVPESRRRGLVAGLPLYPAIFFPSTHIDFTGELIVPMFVSLGIVAALSAVLRLCGTVTNVLLSRRARIRLLLFAAAVYIFAFFKAPVYKRDVVRLPEGTPFLVSLFMAAGLFILVCARCRKRTGVFSVRYSPKFNLKLTLAYACCFYVLTTAVLALLGPYAEIRRVFLGLFLLSGTLAGTAAFVWVLADTVRAR